MEMLNYKEMGEGPPLMILHGLFGSLDNWLTIGKKLADNHHVILVDQRNHGQSFHHPNFTYAAIADDLNHLVEHLGLQQPILMGHSMGGKTIMKFSQAHPEKFNRLIVVDIAPKSYPVHHEHILQAYHSVNLSSIEKRSDAEDQLKSSIKEVGVRQFLLKNLQRDKQGSFSWKINLPVIEKNIEKIGEGLPQETISDRPVMFVRGEKSDYVRDDDMELVRNIYPSAQLVTVKNAGHWIHAEQPGTFLEIVNRFITA